MDAIVTVGEFSPRYRRVVFRSNSNWGPPTIPEPLLPPPPKDPVVMVALVVVLVLLQPIGVNPRFAVTQVTARDSKFDDGDTKSSKLHESILQSSWFWLLLSARKIQVP